MTSKDKHQKHPPVKRPKKGYFTRNEWAILGAPCDTIESLAEAIIQELKEESRSVYIDADHGHGTGIAKIPKLMDMISHHEVKYEMPLNTFDQKIVLADFDLALVNGNHFEAARQIVLINDKKKDSLLRKLDRLTCVDAVILDTSQSQVFDFIIDHLQGQEVPIYSIHNIEGIADFIRSNMTKAPIKGLVLAGGQSIRMGVDKAKINYHGFDQQTYMANELAHLCHEVYISKKSSVTEDLDYPVIQDTFMDLGPFGALLSAFRSDPDAAWLVTACDQPLLKRRHLQTLIDRRDASKMATCYYNPETDFPEPLITLWEPKAYSRLLQFLSLGYACPRKVLINSNINMIKTEDSSFMKNANTPEEKAELLGLITDQE